MLNQVIIYVVAVLIGYFLYRMLCVNDTYHGPVANEVIKYIYHDKETDMYYRYNIKMFICPPSLKDAFKTTNSCINE